MAAQIPQGNPLTKPQFPQQTPTFVFGATSSSTVANLPAFSMTQSFQGTSIPSSQPFSSVPATSLPFGIGVPFAPPGQAPSAAPATGIAFPQLSAAAAIQPSAPPAPATLAQAFAAPAAVAAAAAGPHPSITGVPPAHAPGATGPYPHPQPQPPSNTMTYRQLEELVNQWNAELETNEQMFLEMATELNAWDRVLHESAKGIASVSEDLKGIRKEQDSLAAEMDNLSTQHEEFERILEPLERHLLELRSSRQQGAGCLHAFLIPTIPLHVFTSVLMCVLCAGAGGQRLTPSLSADAHERERLYDMCAELEQQSGQCAAQLRELEHGVRLVTAGAPQTEQKGAPAPDVTGSVVNVLNKQLGALESLERRCGMLHESRLR